MKCMICWLGFPLNCCAFDVEYYIVSVSRLNDNVQLNHGYKLICMHIFVKYSNKLVINWKKLKLKQIHKHFQRHILNVWRMTSVNVAWLTLTHNTETHGEAVFNVAWWSQPMEWDTDVTISKWTWILRGSWSPPSVSASNHRSKLSGYRL